MEDKPLKDGMHDRAAPQIFKNARYLRNHMTPAENLLWASVRNRKLGYKFRRQHPMGRYILDFYCHRLRLS